MQPHSAMPSIDPKPVAPPTIDGLKTLPSKAQDEKLIEHEWVDAINHALQGEADDPHALNDTIAGLRRYYLHKRYGKDQELTKAPA